MKTFLFTFTLTALISFNSCAIQTQFPNDNSMQVNDTIKTTTVSDIQFEFADAKYENGILTVTITALSLHNDKVVAIFKEDYNKKEALIGYYLNYKEYFKSLRVAAIDKNGNEYKPESILIGKNSNEQGVNNYGSIFDLCKNTIYQGTKTKIVFTFKVENKVDLLSLITFDFYEGNYIRDKSPELIFNVKLRNLVVN